jgi:hypothetical protein
MPFSDRRVLVSDALEALEWESTQRRRIAETQSQDFSASLQHLLTCSPILLYSNGGGGEMTVTEILESMQFVVDQDGKPTAALLDIKAWNSFVSLLEDVEDVQLVRERIKDWRSKEGWTRWEDFEAELADEPSSLG